MKRFIIPMFLCLLVSNLACRGTYPPTSPSGPITLTPSGTVTQTVTQTVPVTLTGTPSPSGTIPVTVTVTSTVTWTPTATLPVTLTGTPIPSPTNSITATWTPTSTMPVTLTSTPSSTATIPVTVTLIPTSTATPTGTSTASLPTPSCGTTWYLGFPANQNSFSISGITDAYDQSTAPYSGMVSSLHFYVPSGGVTANVGIYSDNGGQPGTQLSSSNVFIDGSGWNTVSLNTPVNVTGGTNYWLAVCFGSFTTIGGGNNASYSYLTQPVSSLILPSSYGGGAASNIGWLAIYADICPSAGTPTSTPTSTATLTGLDISGPVTLSGGNYDYSYVHVHSNTLYLGGPVTFSLTGYFALDAGASITGWAGYSVTEPGVPSNFASGGAGGGHGGTGGADAQGNSGGSAYDNILAPTLPGSWGGGGSCSQQGFAGDLIQVNVVNGPATLNGIIFASGGAGTVSNCVGAAMATGGASGGTIFIQADTIEGNGALLADGGAGGAGSTYNSGGGGGGIILLSTHTANNFTGTNSVQGGIASSPAQAGQPGAFNNTTY